MSEDAERRILEAINGVSAEVKEIREIEPLAEETDEENAGEGDTPEVDFEVTNPDMISDEPQMTLDFD